MNPNESDKSLKDDEKHEHYGVHVQETQVDEAARFNLGREVDPAEALRVRKKIDKHILPMMCGESVFTAS